MHPHVVALCSAWPLQLALRGTEPTLWLSLLPASLSLSLAVLPGISSEINYQVPASGSLGASEFRQQH